MIRTLLFVLCLTGTGGLACPMPPDALPLRTADTGSILSGYIEMETPPLSAPFALQITFCDPAKSVEQVAFDAIMPAHQHGMNFDVDVIRTGDASFSVSNVVFHMPGLWELQIVADLDGQTRALSAKVLLE